MENIIKILEEINNKPKCENVFTSKIPYLEQDIENQRIKSVVILKLSVIEKEIDDLIFKRIKSCKDIKEADIHFDLLLNILGVLSRLLFVEEISLPQTLTVFVKDFEISHEEYFRQLIFNRIKEGHYNYDFHKSYWGQ